MPLAKTSPDYGTNVMVAGVEIRATDAAIAINNGAVVITKASIAALTLALPTAGTDDGKVLRIFATTAYSHTITTPALGVNGANTIITLVSSPPAAGNGVKLLAYNGSWWVQGGINNTVSG